MSYAVVVQCTNSTQSVCASTEYCNVDFQIKNAFHFYLLKGLQILILISKFLKELKVLSQGPPKSRDFVQGTILNP